MKIKRMQLKADPETDLESSTMSFIASTDRADRYGDIINQDGWDLASYRANPIVLLNHDHHSLPIGRGIVSVGEKGLMIDVEFDMADPRAAEIAGKAARGFLGAVSVGFTPIKSTPRTELATDHPAYSQRGGVFFDSAELLEVSVVTIPANADAVAIAAKGANLQLDSLREMIRSELEAHTIKHILSVVEDEETVTIQYKKESVSADETEEDSEEIEVEAYDMDDEESEEDEKKDCVNIDAFVKALLTLETSNV
jgi:HK97 family phage prohead protease